jgi:ParB/RepB/Spo0J family partition protein
MSHVDDITIDRPSGGMRSGASTRFLDNPATERTEKWIARDDIQTDPENPGAEPGRFRPEDLETLRKDIEANGQDTPVVVGPKNAQGRYPLIAGHRRLAAVMQSGTVLQLRAIIRDDLDSPSKILAYQIRENESRKNVSAIASARSIQRLLRLYGGDSPENRSTVCEATGKSDAALRQLLAVAEADAAVVRFAEATELQDVTTLYKLTRLQVANREEAETYMQDTLASGDFTQQRRKIEERLRAVKGAGAEGGSAAPKGGGAGEGAAAARSGPAPAMNRGKAKQARSAHIDWTKSQPTLYIEAGGEVFRFALPPEPLSSLKASLESSGDPEA